jgi:hypothetical protein
VSPPPPPPPSPQCIRKLDGATIDRNYKLVVERAKTDFK